MHSLPTVASCSRSGSTRPACSVPTERSEHDVPTRSFSIHSLTSQRKLPIHCGCVLSCGTIPPTHFDVFHRGCVHSPRFPPIPRFNPRALGMEPPSKHLSTSSFWAAPTAKRMFSVRNASLGGGLKWAEQVFGESPLGWHMGRYLH